MESLFANAGAGFGQHSGVLCKYKVLFAWAGVLSGKAQETFSRSSKSTPEALCYKLPHYIRIPGHLHRCAHYNDSSVLTL